MGLTTSTAVQPLEGALMLPSRTTLQPKQAVRARCVQLHGGTECQQRCGGPAEGLAALPSRTTLQPICAHGPCAHPAAHVRMGPYHPAAHVFMICHMSCVARRRACV